MSAAPQTAVVTDTTANLPDDLVAEHGIHRVSLYVTLDGRQRAESEITAGSYGDFYQRLRQSDTGATTSQPSVGDFVEIYEPLLADGGGVISIHLGAGISGTCDSASQAKRQLTEDGRGGERIDVLDSRSACGGLAMMVLVAARAIEQGRGQAEALAATQQARESLKLWFAVDTLEYLRKGGRIGAAQALLGSALQIKPILTLEEEVTPIERVRTRRRAFERLVDLAKDRKEAGATAWVVQHIHDPESARALVEQCREIFQHDPVFVSEVGPVIGAHVGPGLLGFSALKSEYLGESG